LRIHIYMLEYFWMHHAATQHFQPAGLLADAAAFAVTHDALDIDFRRWLGEWEVRGTEPHIQLFLKKVTQEDRQHAFEVGKGDVLIHQQTFHLVEHWGMGKIRVTTVNAARTDNAIGRAALLHHPYLYG